jgi:peptide/nickel transport system permease protein
MTTQAGDIRAIKARRGRLENAWRLLKTAPLSAWIGMIVIAVYVICAVFAPWIAPYGEAEIVGNAYQPSSAEFWLGTDQIGRDIFSRLIYGARNTIGIALVTTLLSFAIGGTLGVFAAIKRSGWLDQVLSRLVDALMSIPTLIFSLMLLAVFGKYISALILILALLDSTRVFRLARATAINVVVMDYVEAARLRGEGIGWITRREIIPNILPPLVAEFGLRFCFVFLTISSLSFLGVGIQPPTADWGSMVSENKTLITYGNPTPLYPAAAIAVLTVAVNFVVDWFLHRTSGLRDEH